MCTTDFFRKLLGQSGEWSRAFINKALKFLYIDEAHQEPFLNMSAMLSVAPRAALFGDSMQEYIKATQAGDMGTESSFQWVTRMKLQTINLPVSFRLGPAITAALRATNDYPNAESSPSAPRTALLPLLFLPTTAQRSAGREIYMVPLMYTHLIFCICVEICMACHQETYGTVGVIVYYSVQKLFLEAHLIDSCLSTLLQNGLGLW